MSVSDSLGILTYHSVDDTGSVLSTLPDILEGQMACLADLGFRGTSLGEVMRQRQSLGRWPDRTVAITFDDGYENNLRVAQPILARHGFTASIYLITGHIGGEHDWEEPPAGFGRHPILDWGQVVELADAGWEIGAHTRTHPDLRKLHPDKVAQEIIGSREDIESRLSHPVETFAYPGGYVSDAAATVVEKHFATGCTTELRRATVDDALNLLPRVDMYYLRDIQRLRRLAMGKLDGYLAFRRFGRRVRAVLG